LGFKALTQTVCTPLHLRGLEIRDLLTFNQAILGKWL
jgi:hypothetical protein